MLRFKAKFDGGPAIERASAERVYTHAWRVAIESGGQPSQIHGFTISRLHAELKVAEQVRSFNRPFSRVRVTASEVVEVSSQEVASAPPLRRRQWA